MDSMTPGVRWAVAKRLLAVALRLAPNGWAACSLEDRLNEWRGDIAELSIVPDPAPMDGASSMIPTRFPALLRVGDDMHALDARGDWVKLFTNPAYRPENDKHPTRDFGRVALAGVCKALPR